MVRAITTTPNVARISLAAFVDTPPAYPLVTPKGCSNEIIVGSGSQKRVPPLEQRWTSNGMTFGDFLSKTFQLYCDWKPTTDEGEAEAKDGP
jgi:hypothetical protein